MAVTYCTIADVRAATNNEDLADNTIVTDEQMTAKIEQAEVYIDSIAKYWDRFGGDTQVRTFPRLQDVDADGDSFIPDIVKQATIAQVEFAYENMPDRDHGVVQDDNPTSESISPRAYQLMSAGYIRRTGRVTLPSYGSVQRDIV